MSHENIYYWLLLVYTCEYVYIYLRVSGIHSGFGYPRFGFGDVFPPESVSGSDSDFDFGFGFRCTETPPDPNLTRHSYSRRRAAIDAAGATAPRLAAGTR